MHRYVINILCKIISCKIFVLLEIDICGIPGIKVKFHRNEKNLCAYSMDKKNRCKQGPF